MIVLLVFFKKLSFEILLISYYFPREFFAKGNC